MIDPRKKRELDNRDYLIRQRENNPGNFGIVQTYDPATNTATVLMSAPDSDELGDLITNVPCPVTLGIQNVAPEPGRPCWVVFKGAQNDRKAMISHYFNHQFEKFDHPKLYNARSSIPRYSLGI